MIKFIAIGKYFPRFTDSSLTRLFKFKKLESLEIGMLKIEDDTDYSKYDFFIANILTELPGLKDLDIEEITFDDVEILMKHTPQRILQLNLDHLQESELASLKNLFPNLN